MSTHNKISDVTIIGAGIIGIHIAFQLQKQGYDTTLIDMAPPAQGCSRGNAGILATYGVTPVSMPGLWKQAPAMLMNPEGPLRIRWQHLPVMLPWLVRFLRAGARSRVEKHAQALASLVRSSLRDYQDITRATGLEHLIRPSPLLAVYASRDHFEADGESWDLRRRHGVEWSTLQDDELHNTEPALARHFRFALAIQNTGFTLDPQRLAQGLFSHYMEQGGRFIAADITSVARRYGYMRLHTRGQELKANKVVIACGARSALLSCSLGESVPLEQERGYHVTLSGYAGRAPRHPVMSPLHKVIATPMKCGLRLAGMVEFGGFMPPDRRRTDLLRGQLNELFPRVQGGRATNWMGHRPTLPDSLPVIGQSVREPSVYYAFGHQHVGLTAAPTTARLISELLADQPPSIDTQPFRVNRF